MGLNAYLEAAVGYGYQVITVSATANALLIAGQKGKRVSILSYAFTTHSAATTVAFMVPVPGSGVNSIASALTASSTAIQWGSTRPSNIYSGDYVAVKMDDESWVMGSLNSTATTATVLVSAGAFAAASIGNPVYYFATAGNAGHYRRYAGTAATQYTDADYGGVGRFFGSVMGGPMIAMIPADADGSALVGSWDYVSVGYMNV